jgi:hypothetical protein
MVSATCIHHPTDGSAVQSGSFSVDISLGGSTQVRCDVCTWVVSGGGTDITLDASSVHAVSGGGALDSTSTITLFSLFAQVAVAQSVAYGYLTCQATCGGGVSTHVFASSCVTRTGSGSTTAFSPCDQQYFCNRSYRVCCPNGQGSPSITLLGTDAPACTSGNGCQNICS